MLSQDNYRLNVDQLTEAARSAIIDKNITRQSAKLALQEIVKTGKSFDAIVSTLDLGHLSDENELNKTIDEVINEEKTAVLEVKQNPEAINYLLGMVMKKTKGKAEPETTLKILKEKLSSM